MKNKLYYFVTALVAFTFSSCLKEGGRHGKDESKTVNINVTVARGDAYQLDLSQFGDEDDLATIQTQATDYLISEITQSASSKFMYKYVADSVPKVSSTGTDIVKLKISEPEQADHCKQTEQTLVTINFTLE